MISRFYVWLAWRLPRKLVMWCGIRIMAAGCTGVHYAQDVDTLTAVEALRRWEKSEEFKIKVEYKERSVNV
jgi:hypothetical protein